MKLNACESAYTFYAKVLNKLWHVVKGWRNINVEIKVKGWPDLMSVNFSWSCMYIRATLGRNRGYNYELILKHLMYNLFLFSLFSYSDAFSLFDITIWLLVFIGYETGNSSKHVLFICLSWPFSTANQIKYFCY